MLLLLYRSTDLCNLAKETSAFRFYLYFVFPLQRRVDTRAERLHICITVYIFDMRIIYILKKCMLLHFMVWKMTYDIISKISQQCMYPGDRV